MASRQHLPTPDAKEQKAVTKPEYKYFNELTEDEWLDLEKLYPSMTRQQMEERAANQEWFYWVRYASYGLANLTNVPYGVFRAGTSGPALTATLPLFSSSMAISAENAEITGSVFASLGTASYIGYFSLHKQAALDTLPDWFYNRGLASLKNITKDPKKTLADALDFAALGVTFATCGFSGVTPPVIANYFSDRPAGKWLNALGNEVFMSVYNEIFLSHAKGREFWSNSEPWLYERVLELDILRPAETIIQTSSTIAERTITYFYLANEGNRVLNLGSFGINPWLAGAAACYNTIMAMVPSSYENIFGPDNQLRSILAAQVDAELKPEIPQVSEYKFDPANEPLRRKKLIAEKRAALEKDILPALKRKHALAIFKNEGYLYSLKLRPADLIPVILRGGIGYYLGANYFSNGTKIINYLSGLATGGTLASALYVTQRKTLHDQMLLDHLQGPRPQETQHVSTAVKAIVLLLCVSDGLASAASNTGAFVLLVNTTSPLYIFLVAAASIGSATNIAVYTFKPTIETVQSNIDYLRRRFCGPKRSLGPQVVMREGHESLEPGFVTVEARQRPAHLELADLKAPTATAAMYPPRPKSPPIAPAIGGLGQAEIREQHFAKP